MTQEIVKIMARKFTKVLTLMQAKGGRIELNDADLVALLGEDRSQGGLMYRVASYFSNIRRRAGLDVRAVRNGRKVVAYELVAVVPTATESADPTAAVPAAE